MPDTRAAASSTALAIVFANLFAGGTAAAGGPAPHSVTAAPAGHGPVVVLTKVPKPWYAPRALVVSKFRDSIPEYENIPGLTYKYYTLSEDSKFGGLYLWQSSTQAKAWFNEAWFERVRKERGAEGEVRYFDAPVILDNVKPGEAVPGADGKAVASIVSIPLPAGMNRDALIAEFNKALPIYQAIPGLARKYFVISTDGKFGGIYLWRSREAADAFYNTAWKERVQKIYGTPANIAWFGAPVILPGKLNAPSVSANSGTLPYRSPA